MCDDARRRDLRVGLVPTMGAFHAGHRSLMRAARRDCGLVVVSLFVNPTQFGPNEDLSAYPRDAEGDRAAAEAEGVDVVFTPPVEEMYPSSPRDDGARGRAHRTALRREPPGPLRRCHDGVHEAVLDRRPVLGVLRPQGRGAARGGPAHGP